MGVGEACLQNVMVPLRSRIDEVLSAGLAHMRLAPTGMNPNRKPGMQPGKRNADPYWKNVEKELETALKRQKAHEEEEQKLSEFVAPVQLDYLTRKVEKKYNSLTERLQEKHNRRLAKAASARALEEDLLNDELLNDQLLREYLDGLEASERLRADEVLEEYETSNVPMTLTKRNEIANTVLLVWHNNHRGEELEESDDVVRYLTITLPQLGADALTWDEIQELDHNLFPFGDYFHTAGN